METISEPDVMTESEVSLRLAIHLITTGRAQADVSVALDGAQVRLLDRLHFEVIAFMAKQGWRQTVVGEVWQGRYVGDGSSLAVVIHSRAGAGDVTTVIENRKSLLIEAKKGSLRPSRSSAEYRLMREALGQLMTLESIPDDAVLAIAVPHGGRFVKLAERWRKAPLILRSGIHILTVEPSGMVHGFP